MTQPRYQHEQHSGLYQYPNVMWHTTLVIFSIHIWFWICRDESIQMEAFTTKVTLVVTFSPPISIGIPNWVRNCFNDGTKNYYNRYIYIFLTHFLFCLHTPYLYISSPSRISSAANVCMQSSKLHFSAFDASGISAHISKYGSYDQDFCMPGIQLYFEIDQKR